MSFIKKHWLNIFVSFVAVIISAIFYEVWGTIPMSLFLTVIVYIFCYKELIDMKKHGKNYFKEARMDLIVRLISLYVATILIYFQYIF